MGTLGVWFSVPTNFEKRIGGRDQWSLCRMRTQGDPWSSGARNFSESTTTLEADLRERTSVFFDVSGTLQRFAVQDDSAGFWDRRRNMMFGLPPSFLISFDIYEPYWLSAWSLLKKLELEKSSASLLGQHRKGLEAWISMSRRNRRKKVSHGIGIRTW